MIDPKSHQQLIGVHAFPFAAREQKVAHPGINESHVLSILFDYFRARRVQVRFLKRNVTNHQGATARFIRLPVLSQWWLPEFAEQPIAGTLEYTNGKISLTTIGVFPKPRSVKLGVVPKDLERLPVIHGLSVNGDRFTLLESSEANRTFASHGEGSAEWSATWLLVGVHSDGLESLKVVELSFDCTHVTSFLCHSHFSTTRDAEGRSLTVNYVKPEKTLVRLESHRATLEFDSSLNVREGHAAVALTAVSPIIVIADSPESLTDWFMPKMQQCSRLLALLTDHPISIKWVRVTLENDQTYPWLLYRTGPLNELPPDEHPFSLLFRHTDIQDSFASIVEKWFSTSHVMLSLACDKISFTSRPSGHW